MRFFHSWHNVPSDFQNAVVAVGNFDGFHKGHKAVVAAAVDIAKKENRPVVLLTFEPHPNAFFRPCDKTFRITPVRSKVRAICQLPIDGFFVLRFDRAFADMSADDFIKDVLIKGLRAARIVVGTDFAFGKNRRGDADYIQTRYPELPVTTVSKLRDANGEVISSSRIRAFLRDGEVERAAELMERPFEIEGYVIHGAKLGRTLGFPTINIEPEESILPRIGVYAATVDIDGKTYAASANIGSRPTVGGEGVLLEAFILNYTGDLYGERLRVKLLHFIRPEIKFDSVEALKKQIAEDVHTVERILQ